jgi:hypothetical protein
MSAKKKSQRLIAHFRPQTWVRDYAVDIDDGQEDFDATAAFLSQDLNWIKGFQEHSEESDQLAIEASAAWQHHTGPFEVDVDVDGFMEAQGFSRQTLTTRQLGELRRRFGVRRSRKKNERPHIRKIVLLFVVEHDVQPDDIFNLFNDNMPGWMVGYAPVAVSGQRRPTKEESESMCWDEPEEEEP